MEKEKQQKIKKMPKILATVIETIFAILIVWGFLEGLKSISPIISIIIGFLFGVTDFIISYYWGWGFMAWLMEWLPDPSN